MKEREIKIESTYFNIKDTLECGQIFRFEEFSEGYRIFSLDKCAYVYQKGDKTYIHTLEEDRAYFEDFFDLKKDYSKIIQNLSSSPYEVVKISAQLGKGIRILKQDKVETLFSFIISQNNNIPRIKGIINKLCVSLGEKKEFLGKMYYTFPKIEKLATSTLEFYKSIGLGYRASYIKALAEQIAQGLNLEEFCHLDTPSLNKKLISLHGVGPKVADCVSLFGFNRFDAFPVDVWIEKVYKENMQGSLSDRKKISSWLVGEFKENSGYVQQYLFYYKRSLEDKKNKKI